MFAHRILLQHFLISLLDLFIMTKCVCVTSRPCINTQFLYDEVIMYSVLIHLSIGHVDAFHSVCDFILPSSFDIYRVSVLLDHTTDVYM